MSGKMRQWRKLGEEITTGWWLLVAEVLAVVILLGVAGYTGPQARQISQSIDATALATLALVEPLAICVNASESLVGAMFPNSTIGFQGPGQNVRFVERNDHGWGSTFGAYCADDNNLQRPNPDIGDMVYKETLERQALLAMVKCQIITGAYTSHDLSPYITRQCQACDTNLANRTHSFGEGIASALSQDTMQLLLGQVAMPEVWTTRPCVSPMSGVDACRPGSTWPRGFVSAFMPEVCDACETHAAFHIETAYFATMHDMRSLDVPTNMFPGFLRLDARQLHSCASGSSYLGSVWLEFGSQTKTTARCMADEAPMLVELLTRRTPDGGCQTGPQAPRSANLEEVWVTLQSPPASCEELVNISTGFEQAMSGAIPYACANGVNLSTPDASAYLTSLRSSAKNKFTITLFCSMHDSSYDDVYAVYTGVLGALFGAFALLVATLLLLSLAFLYHCLT